ncbi:MAG: Flp pilus assembly complex ATPase component TadA, partial [Verrucomicrobiales bacterium]|nr:Flp pilus assembly complex ATPase component TadA [Verrucomicrobiales bacterium]
MIPQLLEIAREAGCRDLDSLGGILSESRPGSPSPLSRILDSGLVDESTFLEKIGSRFSMPVWDGNLPADDEVRRAVREAVAADVASRHQVLPIGFVDSEDGERHLLVATDDPFALARHSLAVRNIACPIRWAVGSRQSLAEGLNDLYGVGAGRFVEILQSREGSPEEMLIGGEETLILDDSGDEEASVISFVNQIIRGALEQRATDIHLEPHERNLRIRYRVDGVLQEIPAPEGIGALQASVISRIKIMAKLDIAEKRLPQDGRIHMELDGRTIDVRVATIPSVDGESVSLRLLGQEAFNLDRLGLSPSLRQSIDRLLELPNGIILVTGPTGSGKSTSLYAFLSQLTTP